MTHSSTDGDTIIWRTPITAVLACLLAVAGVVTVYLMGAAQPAPIASQVRVRNDMNYPLRDIVINGHLFGSVNPGKSSGYAKLAPAYDYARVSLIGENREMRIQPDDYAGLRPLGPGKFTYALKASSNGMEMSVERDPD